MSKLTKSIKQVPSNLLAYFKSNLGILIGLFILITLLSFGTDSFLTYSNIITVLRQIAINAFLAIGITYTIITIGVDLSIGSTVALSGVVAVYLINMGLPVAVSVGAAVLCGGIVGFVNGFVISRTGMPQFIVTLATQSVIRGVAYLITEGKSVPSSNATFDMIGNGYILGIPTPVVLMIIALIIASITLNKTKFGRYMYAVGGNKEAAVYSGVNVKNTIMKAFIVSGVMAAIAGVILASRLYSGQPTVGVGYEGDAIAASVLGGVSFSGGAGTIGGMMIGALVIGVLNNGMNLLKIPYYWQLIAKGAVILGAVYVDKIKNKKGKA